MSEAFPALARRIAANRTEGETADVVREYHEASTCQSRIVALNGPKDRALGIARDQSHVQVYEALGKESHRRHLLGDVTERGLCDEDHGDLVAVRRPAVKRPADGAVGILSQFLRKVWMLSRTAQLMEETERIVESHFSWIAGIISTLVAVMIPLGVIIVLHLLKQEDAPLGAIAMSTVVLFATVGAAMTNTMSKAIPWSMPHASGGTLESEMADDRDGTVGLQGPMRWSPSDASLGGIKCFEVPGTINGIAVSALPDWGSAVDAISEDFAKRHHLKIERSRAQHIQLLGGHEAESVGKVVGLFKFRGESHVYHREFHVLRKSMHDVILGRRFLDLTSTLTENYHRIVERIRPCIQSKGRLFLLDESPDERIRCTVNGAEASAFPDTGSDLMLVSGDFARRHNLKVRRERRYRRPVDLIDGSTVLTDGMVLNAELQFDTAPTASQEVDYDQYCRFADHLSSVTNPDKTDATPRSTFVCDLHVIEGLPCDIILSNEFIFQNRVFSRFKDLFFSMPVAPSSGATVLGRSILFVRKKANKQSWLSRLRQAADNPEPEPIPLQAGPSWEERWVAEESRRNRAQLLIATLPHLYRSEAQRQEDEIRNAWDRGNPRPTPTSRLSSRNQPPPQPQVPRTPPRAMPPIPRRPVGAARA